MGDIVKFPQPPAPSEDDLLPGMADLDAQSTEEELAKWRRRSDEWNERYERASPSERLTMVQNLTAETRRWQK